MCTRKSLFLGVLIVLLAAPTLYATGGHGHNRSFSPMRDMNDDSRIRGAWSSLKRFEDRVELTVRTRVEANSPHTLWAFVFNHPEFCATSPCTFADLGDVDVDASIFWATGRTAQPNGRLEFMTPVFEGAPPGQSFGGPGLIDAEEAEIIFIVRSHGEQIPSALGDMITDLNGGCPPNSCVDVQYTQHPDN